MIKDKKNKAKKPVGILNLGRRFRGPAKRALDFTTSSGEGDNQEGKNKEGNNNPESEEDEAGYSEEQYPPADDKYKQLEDRINGMKFQRVPGLDFE